MHKYVIALAVIMIVLLIINIGEFYYINKMLGTTITTTVSITTTSPKTITVTNYVTNYMTVTAHSTETVTAPGSTITHTYTTTQTMTSMNTKVITTTKTKTSTMTKTVPVTTTVTETETVTYTTTTTTSTEPPNASSYEILKYFPIQEGHYVLYRFIDTMNNMNATYQVTIQQQANTHAGLIFLMTFNKINGTGKVLNSAIYGGPNYGGHNLLLFFSGCPVRDEIQLWFRVLKLPLDVVNDTTYNYGMTSYRLLKLDEIEINGKVFDDVIKVEVDNEYGSMNIIKGSGAFYLAKDIGVVKIEFKRSDGTNFTATILDWGREQSHILSGTLTLDGFNPVKGDFAVGLTTCDRFYGEENPAFAKVDEGGEFSLQVYGDTFSLYYGPYIPSGSNSEIVGDYLRETVIKIELLPNKTRMYLSMGFPPPNDTLSDLRNDTEWVSLARSLHRQAWFYVVSEAYAKPEYKYAIYESRTIAVKHPEIYLKADALFNKLLVTAPGMWSYYMDRSENLDEQKKIYKSIMAEGGEYFDWKKFNISMHKPIWYAEIYDETPAFYPFIDIRLFFMGVSLKGIKWYAPPLSMAEFLYFKYKNESLRPYLIVTSNGTAYIAFKQGDSYVVQNYLGKNVTELPEDVILIFNEDSVWYPLMDRDDTGEDPDLKYLVNQYAKGDPIPVLTEDEKKLVDMLRNCTELNSELDYLWATYFAGKFHIRSWQYFTDLFKELYPEDAAKIDYKLSSTSHGPLIIIGRNTYVTRISNLLSPETATLAAIARYAGSRGGLLDTIMYTWLGFFLNYVATRDNPRQGGLMLWFHSELFFVGMDDAMLTKAGNCIMMQTIMASVLDLANFTDMEIYVAGFTHTIDSGKRGGHAILAIYWNGFYGLAENYIWRPYVNALDLQGPLGYHFISTNYGWIVLVEHPPYDNGKIRTNLEYEIVTTIIYHIKELAPNMHIIEYIDSATGVWKLLDDFIKEKLYPDNIETFPF